MELISRAYQEMFHVLLTNPTRPNSPKVPLYLVLLPLCFTTILFACLIAKVDFETSFVVAILGALVAYGSIYFLLTYVMVLMASAIFNQSYSIWTHLKLLLVDTPLNWLIKEKPVELRQAPVQYANQETDPEIMRAINQLMQFLNDKNKQ